MRLLISAPLGTAVYAGYGRFDLRRPLPVGTRRSK